MHGSSPFSIDKIDQYHIMQSYGKRYDDREAVYASHEL